MEECGRSAGRCVNVRHEVGLRRQLSVGFHGGGGERISPHYFPVGPCQTRRHREACPPRQQGASPNHPRSSQRSIPMATEQRHLTIVQ